MGPFVLVPIAAVAALAVYVSQPETDGSQPVQVPATTPVKTPASLEESLGCTVYNNLLALDDKITEETRNFLILEGGKDYQVYVQVWLSSDHTFASYEVSSRFYEFKEDERRRYWPDSVLDVVQKEGFRLRDGVHGNYQRSVLLPRTTALKDIAFSMVRVMDQGFGVKIDELHLKKGMQTDEQFVANQPCKEPSAKQQARPPLPDDGGEQGYEAVYNASISNRLHLLEKAPANTLFRVTLSADGSLTNIVRLSSKGGAKDVRIEVPVTSDPGRIAELKKMKFDVTKPQNGYFGRTYNLKYSTNYWSAGDIMLGVAYRHYGAKIGEARLSPLMTDDHSLSADSFERLEMNAYSDFSPP